MAGLRTECAPVTGFSVKDKISEYRQDFSKPVKLTVVNEAKGHVTCPLYQDGLCNGKQPCVVNDVDMYTTVVVAPIPD